MIAKLAFANVKRSYKEYLLYFLTLMIGVAVFYAFNSITAQSAVLDMSETQSTMIEFVGLLISGVSVFITVILVFLVVYANRFLIKRRNKEFALYLLLGMRKTTLLKMTFAETFFVGAFSLVVGLLLGLLLSQALLFLTAFLFSVEFSGFTFLIAWEQIAKTVIVFLIIFALAFFVNSGYLAKARLITLLQSDKKNDDFKLRSIPFSFALFLLACCCIGAAYYLLVKYGLVMSPQFYASTALVVVGTIMFFYALSGFLLRVVQGMKSLYYRGLNMFVLRQVAARLNTSFLSMAVICLTLFLAITSVCGGISICNAMTNTLDKTTHYSATITSLYSALDDEDAPASRANRKTFCEAYDYDMAAGLKASAQNVGAPSWDSIVKETGQIDLYASGLTLGDLDSLLGSSLSEYVGSSLDGGYSSYQVQLLGISQYNRAREMAGLELVELTNNEAFFNSDSDTTMDYLRDVSAQVDSISVYGSELTLKNELDTATIQTAAFPSQICLLVVPDELVPTDQTPLISYLNVETYNVDQQADFVALVQDAINDESGNSWWVTMSITQQEVFEQSVTFSAVVSYLAIYIGFVLVVACAAILALQQLTDVSDNQKRFRLLEKLGADSRMVRGALLKQIAIAFVFPLLLAVCHSLCAMSVVAEVVSLFGHLDIAQVSLIAMGAFLIMYGFYFVLTYMSSKRMLAGDRG